MAREGSCGGWDGYYDNREELLGQQQLRGAVSIDAGACAKLLDEGKSLLPVGVIAVEGEFARGEIVLFELDAHWHAARVDQRVFVDQSERDPRHDAACDVEEGVRQAGPQVSAAA